jgi:ubiquinone/menaquinone biosynthesis C-methylase UbiE
MSIDVSAIKAAQRNMWTVGDYPDIARTIASVAEQVVARADLRTGVRLLDVATGTGNVAIPAALAGALVTALDLTPKLLEVARERAAQAGAEVDFIEGDAEQLPFEDDSFDRVTSCFGVIFAPRQQVAAAELARVARPGATIVLTAWTPRGINGQMFKTVGSYMPAPPPGVGSPMMWGDEDHVRSLLEATGAELSFERQMVAFEHESPTDWLEYNERVLGPTIMAKTMLEPQGKWDALREDLVKLYTDANEARDGRFLVRAEYLVTVARMPT